MVEEHTASHISKHRGITIKTAFLVFVLPAMLGYPLWSWLSESQVDLFPGKFSAPGYHLVSCPFTTDSAWHSECGRLVVYERPGKESANKVSLPVIRLRPNSGTLQPDPIVFINGGPGEGYFNNSVIRDAILKGRLTEWAWVNDRELIMIDLRGTGGSDPDLLCKDFKTRIHDELFSNAGADALRACLDRFRNAGIDLAAYNTRAIAADLNALRLSLGIEQWNLYGVSYGTRIAQYYLKNYPATVRSTILDGVLPLATSPEQRPWVLRLLPALKRIERRCHGTRSCRYTYGKVFHERDAIIDRYRLNPVSVQFNRVGAPSTWGGGRNRRIVLSDFLIAESLSNLIFLDEAPKQIGIVLTALNTGERSGLRKIAQMTDLFVVAPSVNMAAFMSVRCNDGGIAAPPRIVADDESTAWFQRWVQWKKDRLSCDDWPTDPGNALGDVPLRTDAPVLLLSGHYDPATPSIGAERVARHLSRGYHFIFADEAHGVMENPCAQSLTSAFLEDPSSRPDNACVRDATVVPEG